MWKRKTGPQTKTTATSRRNAVVFYGKFKGRSNSDDEIRKSENSTKTDNSPQGYTPA
tara:strand:+ start:302 stop:472 length:171 start_codon:yes stop_codon:yes gene_type:complete